jgi:hypothetical protein
MMEPVGIDFLLQAVVSAALIVLFGTGYAAAYAWFRLSSQRYILLLACCCYFLLVAATLNLAVVCHLAGLWQALVGLMLLGYLLAPHCIWRLYIRTHTSASVMFRRPIFSVKT